MNLMELIEKAEKEFVREYLNIRNDRIFIRGYMAEGEEGYVPAVWVMVGDKTIYKECTEMLPDGQLRLVPEGICKTREEMHQYMARRYGNECIVPYC